jgi:hypothetical protein
LNSRIKIIIISFLILLICVYTYLKFNPPLQSLGYSWNPKDSSLVVVNIYNKGFAHANLKEVIVNEENQPQIAQLGISLTNGLVDLYSYRTVEEGFSFHEIDAYPITPNNKINQDSKDSIKHYGLVVDYDYPIEKITIKYTYLGLPLTKEIEIDVEE